jgi:hypothetical protein
VNYEKVYAGRIADVTGSSDLRMQLEAVFVRFNENRPEDFKGHSLSVSDVVAVKGQAFYVDTFGFKPMEQFLTQKPERGLSEMKPQQSDKPEQDRTNKMKL